MIPVSDVLTAILSAGGGFQREWLADVIVDGERVIQDLQLESCSVKSDGTAKIRTQGQAVVVYSDDLGGTIIPTDASSWFSPYATYLNLFYVISAGGYSERVQRGIFKVIGVSDPDQSWVLFQDRVISVGSRLTLTLADQFAVTDRERFPAPSSPTDLSSTWAELGRISGIGLNRNVPDAPISRQVTYQESRLDALFDLAALLDGIPYIDPNGFLTIQPRIWPAPSAPLPMGEDGLIVSVESDDLTDDGVYNQVVVRSHDDSQVAILATAELNDGPLRYGGPFGRVPYFAASDFITTPAQAQAYANSLLPTVSRIAASGFSIEALPDPRREVGDVIEFDYQNQTLTGRISELTLSDSGPLVLKVSLDG